MVRRLTVINSIMMAYRAKHSIVLVKSNQSVMVQDVLDLRTKEGYIEGYIEGLRVDENRPNYSKVYRRYTEGVPAIKKVTPMQVGLNKRRVSLQDLYGAHNGLGRYVMSTDKGIRTEQEARRKRVGGYILFAIM